jgi:hypothetical protein
MALRIFGLLLFGFILTRIDLAKTLNIAKKVEIEYLLLSFPLFLPLILIKAWRWRTILDAQGIRIGIVKLFWRYLASFYIGVLTPGRMGEMVKVFYLTEEGNSFGKSFFSVILEKLLDILFLTTVGCVGIFLIGLFKEISFFILFLSILLFLVARRRDWGKRIVDTLFSLSLPMSIKEKISANLNDFMAQFEMMKPKVIIMVLTATLISWTVYYAQLYLLALSLKIEIPFLKLSLFVTISSLVSLIPVTISGIGTRDAVLILLFSTVGLSKELAVAYSTLILFSLYANALIGMVGWIKRPIGVKGVKNGRFKDQA